jgi:segregation and condensation protein A
LYKIRLPNFEGPFDLLLYFIKRDEINIYDIPIAKITQEFLNYIKLMQYFDLELAGEFILMASNLMYIKAQMLLPRPKDEDGDEIEDPRNLLVERLLEYKQIKEGATEIRNLEESERYRYYRDIFQADLRLVDDTENYKNTNLFDLLKAFKKAIERNNYQEVEHHVNFEPITIEEKSEFIMEKLRTKPKLSFFEITDNMGRQHIVVTFLAILDMIKNKKIVIIQKDNFADIFITAAQNLN